MKITNTSIYVIFGFLGAISLFLPGRAMAQAAPGPLPRGQSKSQGQTAEPQATPAAKPQEPAAPPRTTLAGTWKLNHDQSDDGRQRVQVAEGAGNNYPGGGSPGGGYPGGGYPGGGYPGGGGYPRGPWGGYPGGGGGNPNGGPRYDGKDIEDNPRIRSLIYPAGSLMVDLKNPEIDVTDDQSRKLILYTDGRQLPKSSNENHQEVAAHWEGGMLVSDEKGPLGGKMSRTFDLSRDGRQLYETLHIDNGRSPITIRYVYDVPTSPRMQQNREDSDPNRPVLKRHPDDSGSSSQ